METRPHSMSLMVKVKTLKPKTMIKLLYERVPLNKQPYFQHLDDPVVKYIPLDRSPLLYDLSELPQGKYIVCGEAMVAGDVYQASCFETRIERLDNNSKFFFTFYSENLHPWSAPGRLLSMTFHWMSIFLCHHKPEYFAWVKLKPFNSLHFVSALQTGVKVIITISIVMVVMVVIYAIFYQLFKRRATQEWISSWFLV